MSEFRLYVVGERSGNPGEWVNFCRTYVMARNMEEARMVGGGDNPDEPVAEVTPGKPQVLFVEEDCGISE